MAKLCKICFILSINRYEVIKHIEMRYMKKDDDENLPLQKTVRKLDFLAIASLFIAGCLFFLNTRLQRPFLGFGASLFFVNAIVLGIIASSFLLKNRTFLRGLLTLLIIFFLGFLLTLVVPRLLRLLYTPPALTAKNIDVYNNCIEFTKKHKELQKFWILSGNLVFIDDNYYSIGTLLLNDKTKTVFCKSDIAEIRMLIKQLYSMKCVACKREGENILFYKKANWVLSLPIEPGVLYSLSGDNPNNINDEILNANKPFIPIIGKWYMSRHLVLSGRRNDIPVSIPESLIDHSLKIEGINPNKLEMFD